MPTYALPVVGRPWAVACLLLGLPGHAAAIPILSIDDVSRAEYEPSGHPVGTTARLDRTSTGDVTFRAVAIAGSATIGDTSPADASMSPDYTLTIPAGQTEVLVPVYVNDDKVPEPEESFLIRLDAIAGATPGDIEATVTISDDDETPAVFLQDDLHTVLENRAATLPLLANDVLSDRGAYAFPEATLAIVQSPAKGTATIVAVGEPGALDDRIVYAPAPGEDGADAFRYRFCATDTVCGEATATVAIRPSMPQRQGLGFDVPMGGLRALPSPRFPTSAFVAGRVAAVRLSRSAFSGAVWDAPEAARQTDVWEIPPTAEARRWDIVADVEGTRADVRLFLGVDSDGDGKASPDELRCSAIRAPDPFQDFDFALMEPCEMTLEQAPGQAVRYWTLAQNTSGTDTPGGEIIVYEVPVDEGEREIVATGPGVVPAGEDFEVALIRRQGAPWTATRYGYLYVESEPGVRIGRIPVRLGNGGGAPSPLAMHNGQPTAIARGANVLFDVPPGASRVTIRAEGEGVFFSVVQETRIDPAEVDVSFVEFYRDVVSAGDGVDDVASASIEGGLLQEGRYFVRVGGSAPIFDVAVTIEGATPPVPPGAYFNPARPGYGLVLYPAGNDLAGLWYHYLDDGSPTWYWLQGAKPGEDGVWRATVHRAAWDGDSHFLTAIGEALVTPASGDRPTFRFTWRFDRWYGSEQMELLGGDGCPSLDGQPLDASTHWFNPDRAGTGYSVQLWPQYEFFAAFVYDALGQPRFLSGERSGFGGRSRTIDLAQLGGFCPDCAPRAPTRNVVGTLTRDWQADGQVRVQIDAIFGAGVDGTWSVDEVARTLGGPGTTQGCPLPSPAVH